MQSNVLFLMSMYLSFKRFFCLLFLFVYASIANAQLPIDSLKKLPVEIINKKNILVFPVIARSIETNWMFGAAGSLTFHASKSDTVARTSSVQTLIAYTLNKQLIAGVNGSQYLKKEKFILEEQLSYSEFPDKFWGIGNNTPDSTAESYNFHQYYIYLHLMRHLGNKIFIGGRYELQNVYNVTYVKGGLFDKENIVGKNGYLVSGLGVSLTYDTRNDAFSPNKGWYAQTSLTHFDKTFGSTFNYTNFVMDVRTYLKIAANQVLALQAYSFSNSGNEVPIRSLASFGGSNRMRGYYDGRYKYNNQLVLQAEYRFAIYKRFKAVVFTDYGDVGEDLHDYSIKDLKYSYGAGLRFQLTKKEKLNLRIDYGIGQGNNSGFYLQLGEAF